MDKSYECVLRWKEILEEYKHNKLTPAEAIDALLRAYEKRMTEK
jgi:hypothetical protein